MAVAWRDLLENFPDLGTVVALSIGVVDEVVHLAVVFLLTVAVQPPFVFASSRLPLLPREGARRHAVDVSGAPT